MGGQLYDRSRRWLQTWQLLDLAVNGVTIVAVCKPKRLNNIGGFQDLVNVMCDQFALAISRSSGAVTVTRPGQGNGGISIPDGQETIISVVVQPTGEIKV